MQLHFVNSLRSATECPVVTTASRALAQEPFNLRPARRDENGAMAQPRRGLAHGRAFATNKMPHTTRRAQHFARSSASAALVLHDYDASATRGSPLLTTRAPRRLALANHPTARSEVIPQVPYPSLLHHQQPRLPSPAVGHRHARSADESLLSTNALCLLPRRISTLGACGGSVLRHMGRTHASQQHPPPLAAARSVRRACQRRTRHSVR